jgi:energy-coupling factor transporter ATP-binding protein EcfA2
VFEQVQLIEPPSPHRSLFLLGAAPQWDDLAAGLDASREVNEAVLKQADLAFGGEAPPTLLITGYRGSGKSTLLMRSGLSMTSSGRLVFHAYAENLPDPVNLARAVAALDRQTVLCIDDGEWIAGRLSEYQAELNKLAVPPLMIVTIRTNALHLLPESESLARQEVAIGDLSEADVDSVIGVLKRTQMLGRMTGKPIRVIRDAFMERARKQLLVAMREVTAGERFDKIIRKEFREIEDPELRVVYLCACLASAHTASLTRRQLLAVSEYPPARLLSALERELRQLLIPAAGYEDRWVARHPLIAELIIDRLAPRDELGVAYRRLLTVLAHDVAGKTRSGIGRRWLRLYKRLINHRSLYDRFQRSITEARAVYDAIAPTFNRDAHFWLQYGSLELEYGENEFARHYLTTAEGLHPADYFIRNAKAHLLLAEGCRAGTEPEARALLREAEESLRSLIMERDDSPYPWHILIAHKLDWLEVWEHDKKSKSECLKELLSVADEARQAFPRNRAIGQLREKVFKKYLQTGSISG